MHSDFSIDFFGVNSEYRGRYTYNKAPTNGRILSIEPKILARQKSSVQIWKENQAYIVSDDIELGISNRLPLWIFGFLY